MRNLYGFATLPNRSSLQLQLSSRTSQIWFPVDSKSTDTLTMEAVLGGLELRLHYRDNVARVSYECALHHEAQLTLAA